ncbi:MAG: glycosyltransferase family 9 protein [Nitrospinota bacterium]
MRIAIVRLTSLGDVVHTLPVAHALRCHRSISYIVWIVEEREQVLLLNNPAVDEVVVAPTRRWRRELRTPAGAMKVLKEFRGLRDQLRSLSIDVAIDVQGRFPKSTIFTLLTGAPMRIGLGWRHVSDTLSSLFITHRVTPPREAVHVVEQNMSLLGPLGVPVRDLAFPLPVVPVAERKAEFLLQGHGVTPRDRLLVLLPAARRPGKRWPPPRYRELANRLWKEAAVRILLLPGPGEEGLFHLISDGLDGRCIPIGGTSIPELVAFLRGAHLAVGNDTGPLHLAAALGVPTIGLYGPTRAERNGPYGPRGRTISSPTGRIEDIPVDRVFQAAMEWLG